MTNEELKKNFSNNLTKLRKANNLTQLQLAEKLNYSDKAISKWEVGSVLPDVETISQIADFFGITVNDLIYPERKKILKSFFQNHLLITLGSFGLIWFLSTIIYFVIEEASPLSRAWLTFIFTIPISFIDLIIFTSLWFKRVWIVLSVSGFFWGVIISLYIALGRPEWWFLFIIGTVGQIVILIYSQIKRRSIKK